VAKDFRGSPEQRERRRDVEEAHPPMRAPGTPRLQHGIEPRHLRAAVAADATLQSEALDLAASEQNAITLVALVDDHVQLALNGGNPEHR
jgi:hypothetical protein